MRLLLSCVSSSISLGGFDWDTGELFWNLPSKALAACGVCYHNDRLLIASEDSVTAVSPHGVRTLRLPGPYPSLAHGIHPIDDETFGVVDTGNSCLRLYDREGNHLRDVCPIRAWPDVPPDAVHLNDFVVTPQGIIGSCFDFRPFRTVRTQVPGWNDIPAPGVGLLLNLSDLSEAGRIVACGLNHPHSLIYREPEVVHCCSSTGSLHFWQFADQGTLQQRRVCTITDEHFLRGVLPDGERWFLGGSTTRHSTSPGSRMAVYRLTESTGHVECKWLPLTGEIYDILPWDGPLLHPIVEERLLS